jgi:cytochrome P450 family 103
MIMDPITAVVGPATAGEASSTPLDQAELPFLDLRSPEYLEHPVEYLMELMSRSRLARSERGVEVLPYSMNAELYNDQRMRPLPWQHYASKEPPIVADFTKQHLLHMEADRHRRTRRILVKAFSPGRISGLRPTMQAIAEELTDKIIAMGECDITADFTHYYTVQVLCALIGVPTHDVDDFGDATLEMMLLLSVPFEGRDERLVAAVEKLGTYVSALIDQKRGGTGTDFISTLVNAPQEDRLTDEEIVWGMANLLFAGHDTTRYQLALTVLATIKHGFWQQLRADPGQIPGVVEEALRRYPTVSYNSRLVEADDVVLGGVAIPKGTRIVLNTGAAAVDDACFSKPTEFDPERESTGRVPFGHGLHKCLGYALARQGMEVGMEVLTRRISSIEIIGEVEMMPADGGAMGPKHLPVRLTP